MNLPLHMEKFLGQFEGGWKDPDGEQWLFQIGEAGWHALATRGHVNMVDNRKHAHALRPQIFY